MSAFNNRLHKDSGQKTALTHGPERYAPDKTGWTKCSLSFDISELEFADGFLVITIDGKTKRFQLKEGSPILEKASQEERSNFEIYPSG